MPPHQTTGGSTVIPIRSLGGGVWLVEALSRNGRFLTSILVADILNFNPPSTKEIHANDD